MTESASEQKQRQLLSMLERGLVMIHVDPRREGVVVPEQFKAQAVLRLNLAYGFNLPALDIDEEGVYAVLSFSRQDFGCTLPWSSVFAITMPDANNEGTMWPGSLPAELRESVGDTSEQPSSPDPQADTALRVVPSPSEQPPGDEEEEVSPELQPDPPERPRPALLLVK